MKMGDRLIYCDRVATIICTELHSTENGKFSGKAIVYTDGGRLMDAIFVEDLRNITDEEMLEMCGDMVLEEYTGE